MKKVLPFGKITNARTVKGAGRGKKLGIATVNFDPNAAVGLKEGIYVCRVTFKNLRFWGVLHYGPRPVFNEANNAFEAHLFEFSEGQETKSADIEIYDFIRKVANFRDKNALVARIKEDISFARRKILSLGS